MQSLSEHDVHQEVAERERARDSTLHTRSFQERAFSQSIVKAQRKFGLSVAEVFQEDTGLAVFTVNVKVRSRAQSCRVACRGVWMVLDTDRREKCVSSHLLMVRRRLTWDLHLCSRVGVSRRQGLNKALHGLRSTPRLWGTRDPVLAALVMCLEGREYVLRQSCADLALWIIVWLGDETGLVLFDDQGQAIGSVLGCVLTHVDDMLAAGDIPNLQLVVDALTREREITQSRTIGPGREGEITHIEMWLAVMPGGGF